MNERIRELAEQVNPRFTKSYVVGPWYAEDIEMFAQLIVRECIDISTDVENEALQNQEFKAGSAATLIKVLIKKHFGVE
jgi:hypothetical protein